MSERSQLEIRQDLFAMLSKVSVSAAGRGEGIIYLLRCYCERSMDNKLAYLFMQRVQILHWFPGGSAWSEPLVTSHAQYLLNDKMQNKINANAVNHYLISLNLLTVIMFSQTTEINSIWTCFMFSLVL